MKKLILLSVLFAFVGNTNAQTTYDIFTYTEPKGYKKETKPGRVTYTKMDSKTGNYCIISLYAQTASTGDVKKDFENDWQELVETPFGIKDTPKSDANDDITGWKTYSGGANFEFNGGTSMALLTTAKKDNANASILIVTNTQTMLSDADVFLSKLKLGKPGATTKPIVSNNTTNSNTTQTNSNVKADVWMNIQSNSLSGMAGSDPNNAKFYVTYPDGDYCSEMPFIGLQTFDKAKSKSTKERTWGKFNLKDGTGSFVSAYENITLKKVSATKYEKVGYTYPFYKCASVDGLKLNGAWSSIPNFTKDTYYSQPGCRRVIYFKPDGSFDDRGIFVSDCDNPNR
jgi:hypothetical protein